jgi:hypothetical protein
MPGTARVTLRFAYSDGTYTVDKNVRRQSIAVSGTLLMHSQQSVGTSQEALDLQGLSTGGLCMIINRDATNYVFVRAGDGLKALVRLKAGEPSLFRISSDATIPRVQADTASVIIEVLLLEA